MNYRWFAFSVLFLLSFVSGCARVTPLSNVDYVDLQRFMGRWYVIGGIPTFFEKGAHNPTETYQIGNDGAIDTTFTFNEGSFDGDVKSYHPKGFIVDKQSNAIWEMQFLWPFRADYRIIYLDDQYANTVIGREKRDYLWIMSREPRIEKLVWEDILVLVESAGYSLEQIYKFPHEQDTQKDIHSLTEPGS